MTYSLSAQLRTSLGKRSKDERAQARVPAVMYGHEIASKNIAVGKSDFLRLFSAAGYSSLIDLTLDQEPAVKVLVKEIQRDPLTLAPVHVDFYQVRMDEEITAAVPLKFVGESRAIKEDGGTLIKSLDTIEVRCLPADLPHEIEVDLSSLMTFDDAITVGALALPKGVIAVTDSLNTITTVARPFTEEELKKMEETAPADISAIKTEGEEKKAAEEAKKAEETAVEDGAKAKQEKS